MALEIPETGFLLESSEMEEMEAALPMQAFAITLSDSVIEEMIECAQSGQDISLSLGDDPVSLACYAGSRRQLRAGRITTPSLLPHLAIVSSGPQQSCPRTIASPSPKCYCVWPH